MELLFNPTSSTVTPDSNKVDIVASVPGITYDEIQSSIGPCVYRCHRVYISSSNAMQLTKPVVFNETDANGKMKQNLFTPTIDPYQRQSAVMDFTLRGRKAVLDGRSDLAIEMEPLSTATFVFFMEELTVADLLPGENPNKDAYHNFFTGYKDHDDF